MTRDQMIGELHKRLTKKGITLTKKSVVNIIESMFEMLHDDLMETGKTTLPGIGTLRIKDACQRKCTNPQTKKQIIIPAHKVVKINVYRGLKEEVAQKK